VPLGLLPRNPPKRAKFSPSDEQALVLYEPRSDEEFHVVVDPSIAKHLHPHQREGVQFVYDCVTGTRVPDNFGCILADGMGVGKTIQVIAVITTLLEQSQAGAGTCTVPNVMVVTPASLVKNWEDEFRKWLINSRLRLAVIDGGGKDVIERKITDFVTGGATSMGKPSHTPLLILSYDTLRVHRELFGSHRIGLLVADEAHRLKNRSNQSYTALGTPIQYVIYSLL
jgi:DNA repair and recombination RAD54-like protein